MTTLQESVAVKETMTRRGAAAVPTGVAGQQLMRSRSTFEDESSQVGGWNRHISKIVWNWMPNRVSLEDDGFTPPSLAVFDLAVMLAESFRDKGVEPPDRVVLDGDGGIVFERTDGDLIQSIEVYGGEEPRAEVIRMKGGKIYFREEIVAVAP